MGLFSWLVGGKKAKQAAAGDASAERPPAEGGTQTRRGEDGAPAAGASPGSAETTEAAAELEALVAQLDSSRAEARIDAARALLDRWREGDAAAAQALGPHVFELLEDKLPSLRQLALVAVRLFRKPENLEKAQSPVLARLADPAAQVRTAAIWAAIHLPGEVARTQVRAQLQSPEETMRFAAACALADKQDGAALPELVAALEEGHRRQEALTALMTLGDARAVEAIGALFEKESVEQFDRTLAAAALARFGDARGPAHLIERIESAGDDRPVAAEWAGRVGAQEAAAALFALADEEGEAARGAALRALGRLRAEGAWEKLRGLASDTAAEEDLRMDAAEGVAELGLPEARALLESLRGAGGELGPLCAELVAEMAAAETRLVGAATISPEPQKDPSS